MNTVNDIQIDCGLHIANVVIRSDAKGDIANANSAHARLHALVDAQPDPSMFVIGLARRLGRDRARLVQITEETILLATA